MAKKLILLPDEPQILGILADSLFQRESFELRVTTDGFEALAVSEEEAPALAILDLEMTGLVGDECCLQIKQDPLLRATPVILLAPAGDAEALARCRRARCDEIVFLPACKDALFPAACRLLGISSISSPRFEVRLPVIFAVPGKKPTPCHALDLNSGGTFIQTEKLLPVDHPIILEFSLGPDQPPIRCQGRVAWVNHPEWMKKPRLPVGLGVQFLELPSRDLQILLDYLRLRLSQSDTTAR